ncbi:hypothetical protein ABBQ32_008400 [Trebouxia sp. C0010 RCD-2024]
MPFWCVIREPLMNRDGYERLGSKFAPVKNSKPMEDTKTFKSPVTRKEIFKQRHPKTSLKTSQDCCEAHRSIRTTQEKDREACVTAQQHRQQADLRCVTLANGDWIRSAKQAADQDHARLTKQAKKVEEAYKSLKEHAKALDRKTTDLENQYNVAGDKARFSVKELEEAERRVRNGEGDIKYVRSVQEELERAAVKREQELGAAKVRQSDAANPRHIVKHQLVRSSPSHSSNKPELSSQPKKQPATSVPEESKTSKQALQSTSSPCLTCHLKTTKNSRSGKLTHAVANCLASSPSATLQGQLLQGLGIGNET